MATRVYFDGVPTVRLTQGGGVPEKLVIPGHALAGKGPRNARPEQALAYAIARANGLRWTGSLCRDTDGNWVANYTGRRRLIPGEPAMRMPAAEVRFRVAPSIWDGCEPVPPEEIAACMATEFEDEGEPETGKDGGT